MIDSSPPGLRAAKCLLEDGRSIGHFAEDCAQYHEVKARLGDVGLCRVAQNGGQIGDVGFLGSSLEPFEHALLNVDADRFTARKNCALRRESGGGRGPGQFPGSAAPVEGACDRA